MTSRDSPDFDDFNAADGDRTLLIDLEGFEGPLDLLLSMARDQKIDLRYISILAMADHYISYIERLERVQDGYLEIAADYLVMAAWLAYLKSRLLLPQPPEDEEASGTEMAAVLALRLRRYEAMKKAAHRLMERPQLGRDLFKRGEPIDLETNLSTVYTATLYDVLRAYGQRHAAAADQAALRVVPSRLHSMDDALTTLGRLLAQSHDWFDLRVVIKASSGDQLIDRSVLASSLAASLELARNGAATIRQEYLFGPIYLRDAHSNPQCGKDGDD